MIVRHLIVLTLFAGFASVSGIALGAGVSAPTTPLKVGYLANNAAQASKDPATGILRGVVPDVFAEMAKRSSGPMTLVAISSPAAVLDAVRTREIDIGFVAPNPGRMGVVAYSQTYMFVQQSFLVAQASPIQSVTELGKAGQTLGANGGDSMALYAKMNLSQAALLESADFTMKEAAQWLVDGKIVAFGGNRQRLGIAARNYSGVRLLPDNLYGVPQAVAVANDKPELLAWVDSVLSDLRNSGFLQDAMTRSGVDGVSVAPALQTQ